MLIHFSDWLLCNRAIKKSPADINNTCCITLTTNYQFHHRLYAGIKITNCFWLNRARFSNVAIRPWPSCLSAPCSKRTTYFSDRMWNSDWVSPSEWTGGKYSKSWVLIRCMALWLARSAGRRYLLNTYMLPHTVYSKATQIFVVFLHSASKKV